MPVPKYLITLKLLESIKKISALTHELNRTQFPGIVLAEFEKKANSLSAFASTSIEGNPLPLTEVKKIIKSHPKNIRDSEREVLNYNNALKDLNEQIKNKKNKFTLQLILKIHRQVMSDLLIRMKCGQLRKEPVFVHDPKKGEPVYLPPDHGDVSALMTDLVEFANSNVDAMDPIILAGIFHKQFVIIHPFIDGNGRTARLATKALLANMGLDTFNLFSFENYYNQNVGKYFQHVGVLGNYYEIARNIDFTPWLEYFSDGIIDELLRVQKELQTANATPATTLQPYHVKIVEHIKKHGFITDAAYAKLSDRAKATRNLDFNKLIARGIIERQGKGKSTYYKLLWPE